MAKKKSDIPEVDIRPGVGALGMFKYMDYTPWHAIGEFVDNSVASWQLRQKAISKIDGSEYRLKVNITLDPSDRGELRIWDNAGGISAVDYKRAFKPAERPADRSSLSQYGMGMKTAACWFSDHWRVTSTALGEPVIRTIEFNIPELIKNGTERIVPIVQDAQPDDHWTELVLWDLAQIPQRRSVGKIKDYLSQMYRHFIARDGVEITWNGEPLHYRERPVLVAPFYRDGPDGRQYAWEKPLDFYLPMGEHITGRALLFEKGEQSAAGLHLFWRGRMIKGNLEDFYRPNEIFQFAGSYRVQRLLVELDMDSFTPTVDKQDFQWDRRGSTSEADFLKALKKELNRRPLALLDQADNYRSTRVSTSSRTAAREAAKKTASAVAARGGSAISDVVEKRPRSDKLPLPTSGMAAGRQTLEISVRGESWQISIELNDKAAHRNEWLAITEKPPTRRSQVRTLGIRISLAHPFTTNFATDERSMSVLIRLAAGLALSEIAARQAGTCQPGDIRRNLNELLLNVLATS